MQNKTWWFGYNEAERKEKRLLEALNEHLISVGLYAQRGCLAAVCKECKKLLAFVVNDHRAYFFITGKHPLVFVNSSHDLNLLYAALKKVACPHLRELKLNPETLRSGELPPHELTHRAFDPASPIILFNIDIVIVDRESEQAVCLIEASYPTKEKAVYALKAVAKELNLPAFYLCYTAEFLEGVHGYLVELNGENVVTPPNLSELKPIGRVAGYLLHRLGRR